MAAFVFADISNLELHFEGNYFHRLLVILFAQQARQCNGDQQQQADNDCHNNPRNIG